MRNQPPRRLAVFVALAAAVALGIAYASEVWGGLVPCELCLLARWPYRIIIVLGLIAVIAPRNLVRPILSLTLLCLLADAAIAIVHIGVEQHFWPSPFPQCASPRITGASIAERFASMPARPSAPCDEPTFLVPGVPLSMASLNLLFLLVFIGALSVLLPRRSVPRR